MSRKEDSEYLKTLDVPAFLERPEVAQYVGKNFDHYKAIWLKDYAKKGSAARMMICMHWQWMAFLFWPAWYGYRRMWPLFLTFLAISVGLAIYQTYYENMNCRASHLGFGALIVTALLAKSFYFSHVVAFFRKYDRMPGAEKEELLRQNSGPSVMLGVLASIGFVAVTLGASLATDSVYPPTPECIAKAEALQAEREAMRAERTAPAPAPAGDTAQ